MMKPVHALRTFILFCLALFCGLSDASAQQSHDPLSVRLTQLETGRAKDSMLDDVMRQLQDIRQQAARLGKDAIQAHAIALEIAVRDRRSEDSLYFCNSAILDTLLYSPASSPGFKAILHVLKAKRLSAFSSSLAFRYAGAGLGCMQAYYYTASGYVGDSIALLHLDTACRYEGVIADVNELHWLLPSPEPLAFPASARDIFFFVKISMLAKKTEQIYADTSYVHRLRLPSPSFWKIWRRDSVPPESRWHKLAMSYDEWRRMHAGNHGQAGYIEALFRTFIYSRSTADSLAFTAYESWLMQQQQAPDSLMKHAAIYQLCRLWVSAAGLHNRLFLNGREPRDTAHASCANRALQLYRRNRAAMTRYPVWDSSLRTMERAITEAGLEVKTDHPSLPAYNIPLHVFYRNVDSFFYRVVRVNAAEDLATWEKDSVGTLLTRPAVASGVFRLLLPEDHNVHGTYLKIDSLPAGHYRLLFSSRPIDTLNSTAGFLAFTVTAITAVYRGHTVFLLDRKTGFPLKGAQLAAFNDHDTAHRLEHYTSSADGSVEVRYKAANRLLFICRGDTVFSDFRPQEPDLHTELYDPEVDDGLADFYCGNLEASVFLDRDVYRPGQKVYYKAILKTIDPVTTRAILFNQANLGKRVFADCMRWIRAAGGAQVVLKESDRVIDSSDYTINEYGSIAGSFIIPATIRMGRCELSVNGTSDMGGKYFRVEEYKRPQLLLSMEKPARHVFPGDAFTVRLKLRSFSGAIPQHVPVSYTVFRYGNIPADLQHPERTDWEHRNTKLFSDTLFTDEQGDVLISVNDTAMARWKALLDTHYFCTYLILATAVDLTGEMVTLQQDVRALSLPVHISMPLQNTYDVRSLPVLRISTSTEEEGSTGKTVQVKLFRTLPGDTAILDRDVVDIWHYRKEDWGRWFPASFVRRPLEGEKVLVFDTVINIAVSGELKLPAAKMIAGVYTIWLSVVEKGRMTGEMHGGFQVFDSKRVSEPFDRLDYLPKESYHRGDMLTWHTSSPDTVYAIYRIVYLSHKGKPELRVIYQTRMELPGLHQWTYRIPTDIQGSLSLERVSMSHGLLYTTDHSLNVISDSIAAPKLILGKYRQILAPGEKATFSVSLQTKDALLAGELLTTLYDASLDEISAVSWDAYENSIPTFHDYGGWQGGDIHRIRAGELDPDDYGITPPFRATRRGEEIFRPFRGDSFGVADGLDGKTDGLKMLNELDVVQRTRFSALSTARHMILPEPRDPVVSVRKNFNETAFFFPQLHAGKDGAFRFTFTMPESVTQWHWKMLAHTADAQFAALDRTLQTQLPLMIQPNMPRLLYQRDHIVIKSRISNLDSRPVTGRSVCRIEDAVTGEDITARLTPAGTQLFQLAAKSSAVVGFGLTVPAQQLNPLRIILSAEGNNSSDAEEHVIPVLSPRVFVQQSREVHIEDTNGIRVDAPGLPPGATLQGVGLSITPDPHASLLHTLPGLANYPYDCAEQTFNKLRALVMALHLMRTDTAVQRMYQLRQISSPVDPAQATLIADINPQGMPWFDLATRTARQQRQLSELLDTVSAISRIRDHLRHLQQLQDKNGGDAWFTGGAADEYISSYLLTGFGQLKELGCAGPACYDEDTSLSFLPRLEAYVRGRLLAHPDDPLCLQHLYALSYQEDKNVWPDSLEPRLHKILADQWKLASTYPLSGQAMLIIATLRHSSASDTIKARARHQLESLRQLAIHDPQNGWRWKDLITSDELSSSEEETMALMAEAFAEGGTDTAVQQGIVTWLLQAREQEYWQTTKATAAAIHTLQRQAGPSILRDKDITAILDGKRLQVSGAVLSGQLADYTPLTTAPQTVRLRSAAVPVSGTLTWYYFTDADKLDTADKPVHISRQFYSRDSNGQWMPLADSAVLKTGVNIQVRLTIETDRKLRYVHIHDPRAACLEPVSARSGYQYADDWNYYRSVRDAGVDLFADWIPRGRSELSYEVRVAQEGTFSNGPAMLQCMYQPGLAAYGTAAKLVVK